ncbi:peptidoglycan editing factor PgeF [Sulfurimonas sp.]|uniref:peptidoglycan editing factor PgeF n=1 Tax=Sulfurimonas sp. TaxID=2022749 RepID=UPI0025F437E5|nr:peptidoglycan editing factor PgeF [Sulfurimonas sp.]
MNLNKNLILNNFPNLTHAFTTKDGGVSKSPFTSLNLAFHVEDSLNDVIKNHDKLASKLNYERRTLVHMKQIHSDAVHIVSDIDNFDNPPTCDALITDKTNVPLMVMVADCSPILFYDSKKEVIAVAHAGRQGAFKNIVQNVINSFVNIYGSDAKDISASVGASIGVCCYEVGAEIYDEAKELGLKYSMQKREDSFYLDVSAILKTQLLASGIKKENIEISKECSCCKNEKYFSYRADANTGRFAGILMMKE